MTAPDDSPLDGVPRAGHEPPRKWVGLAPASLVVAVVSWIAFPFPVFLDPVSLIAFALAPTALGLGIAGVVRARRSGRHGTGLAAAAVAISGFQVALFVLMLVLVAVTAIVCRGVEHCWG